MEKATNLGNSSVVRQVSRVGVMFDLQWPYKRHSEIFAGVQRYGRGTRVGRPEAALRWTLTASSNERPASVMSGVMR